MFSLLGINADLGGGGGGAGEPHPQDSDETFSSLDQPLQFKLTNLFCNMYRSSY